ERAPFGPGDRLPGAPRVTYATVLRFERIADDRVAWEAVKGRLQRLRDVSAALGLAGALPDRPAPPGGPPPPRFSPDPAPGRLAKLEKAYPQYQQDFRLAGLPDAVVGEVRRAVRTSYDNAIEAGRQVVLRHLAEASPDGQETPESWRRLRPWLAAPDDLQAW